MKKTNYFFHMLIVLGICGFMYCSDGTSGNSTGDADSTATNSDSTSAVHHIDPANAYPQPPVTGTDQDSSRLKDSQNRAGH